MALSSGTHEENGSKSQSVQIYRINCLYDIALLRSSHLEQCAVGSGPSLLQLLPRDGGRRNHHQLRALQQPASQVTVRGDSTFNSSLLNLALAKHDKTKLIQMVFFVFYSKIKENKNASEIIKSVNMLVSSMNSEYLWEYMTRRFCTSLRYMCGRDIILEYKRLNSLTM